MNFLAVFSSYERRVHLLGTEWAHIKCASVEKLAGARFEENAEPRRVILQSFRRPQGAFCCERNSRVLTVAWVNSTIAFPQHFLQSVEDDFGILVVGSNRGIPPGAGQDLTRAADGHRGKNPVPGFLNLQRSPPSWSARWALQSAALKNNRAAFVWPHSRESQSPGPVEPGVAQDSVLRNTTVTPPGFRLPHGHFPRTRGDRPCGSIR